jgi:probable HAF family extracellular repeat protein
MQLTGFSPRRWFRSPVFPGAAGFALLALVSGCQDSQDSSAPVPQEPESFLSRTPSAGFTIMDLGTLGGDSSVAYGLSGNNKVVGVSRTASGELHAFVWNIASPVMQDLGTLGGDFSVAYALNGADQIVGQSTTTSGEFHAFIATSTQAMTDLGTLGGNYSIALGINQLAEVVGLSKVPSGELHAFKWTQSTGMVDLGTMGGDYSVGYGIDPFGSVVGYSKTPAGLLHAYRQTTGGAMTDLGVLPGGRESWAQDASTRGSLATGPSGPPYVAGYSEVRIPDPPSPSGAVSGSLNRWIVIHAFRWTPSEGMVDLGAGGGLHSFGLGVNEFGDVVGQVVNIQGEDRAFFWNETGGFYNLGTLGGPTSFANAVTSCGFAVGGSEDASGKMHATLWTKACPRSP